MRWARRSKLEKALVARGHLWLSVTSRLPLVLPRCSLKGLLGHEVPANQQHRRFLRRSVGGVQGRPVRDRTLDDEAQHDRDHEDALE